jgi:hypothetical protein
VTDERTRIFTMAQVPPSLEREWLQHLRNFDTAHPGCHFEVIADTPHYTFREIIDLLRVNPHLPLQEIIARKKPQ